MYLILLFIKHYREYSHSDYCMSTGRPYLLEILCILYAYILHIFSMNEIHKNTNICETFQIMCYIEGDCQSSL